MPRIEVENDEHVFVVQVKNKCSVCVDAFELSGRMMDMGKEDVGIDEIESVMRDIAWTDSGDMGSVDKYEMFAVASKVMKRMEALGK
tara:strand:- start:1371 stop:1631 length:261 start_codon:yes stop_codon:yes gene_type:complete